MDRFVNRVHLQIWLKCRLIEAVFGWLLLLLCLSAPGFLDLSYYIDSRDPMSKIIYEFRISFMLSVVFVGFYYFVLFGVLLSGLFFICISRAIKRYNIIIDSAVNCLLCVLLMLLLLLNWSEGGDDISKFSGILPPMACVFAAHICMHAAAALRQYRKARLQSDV